MNRPKVIKMLNSKRMKHGAWHSAEMRCTRKFEMEYLNI
jgi:hypothetical protein